MDERWKGRHYHEPDVSSDFGPIIRPRMTKRGYSREFKPHGETGKRYLLDEIPAGLWADVKAKCKRDGTSIRAVILTLLKEWLAR